MSLYWGNGQPGSIRSKIRIATWNDSGDPTVFGKIEVDLTEIDNFLEKYNEKNPDNKLTYTVIFAKAFGQGLSTSKHLSGKIAFGAFVPSNQVNISVLCDIGGTNLANVLVEGCDKNSLKELNDQLKRKVKSLKMGKDKDFNKQTLLGSLIPSFLTQIILVVSSWICYDLNLAVPPLNLKPNNYGNGILTNVSNFNVFDFSAPHVPFLKTIVVAVMNTPALKPVVVDGKIIIRKIMNLNISYDHRFADGSDAPRMLKNLERVFSNPSAYL